MIGIVITVVLLVTFMIACMLAYKHNSKVKEYDKQLEKLPDDYNENGLSDSERELLDRRNKSCDINFICTLTAVATVIFTVISTLALLTDNIGTLDSVEGLNRKIQEITAIETEYKVTDTFMINIENNSDSGYVDSVMAMILKEKLEVNKEISDLQYNANKSWYLIESVKDKAMNLQKMK